MTVNKQTGAVLVKDETGQDHVLRFGTNEMVMAEEEFGMSIVKLAGAFQDQDWLSLTNVRSLVWCGLSDADIEISKQAVGRIIDAEGGLVPIMEKVQVALTAAFPEQEDAAGNADAAESPAA